MSSRNQTIKLEGSKGNVKRRKRSSSGSSESEGSTRGLSSSSHREKRKRLYRNNSRDEFKKARPPTFNGEKRLDKQLKLGFLG